MKKQSKYPTKKQLKEWAAQLDTVDQAATEFFNVEHSFGFRFNHNFRWFWAQAITYYNFKTTLVDLPLSEAKIVTQIHLN